VVVPRQISQFRLGMAKGPFATGVSLDLALRARKAVKERAWRDDCEILPLNLGRGQKQRLRLAPTSLIHSAARERDCLRAWCEGVRAHSIRSKSPLHRCILSLTKIVCLPIGVLYGFKGWAPPRRTRGGVCHYRKALPRCVIASRLPNSPARGITCNSAEMPTRM